MKVSKYLQQHHDEGNERQRELRKWFVWPAYTSVRQIPAKHRRHYEDLMLNHPSYQPSALVASVPYTQPPAMCDKPPAPGQGRATVAWRASYKVVFQCPETGRCRAKCVEPEWEKVHSRGEEVWIDPERIAGWSVRQQKAAQGQPLQLGYVLMNSKSSVIALKHLERADIVCDRWRRCFW